MVEYKIIFSKLADEDKKEIFILRMRKYYDKL